MRIKMQDGGEANVTPQGQGSLNTVLGAVGTAGALGMLGIGRGLFGGGRPPMDEGDRPVTRYEMGLIKESMAKDNEIALLKAQKYTDEAMSGMQAQIGKQLAWNAAQQAYMNVMEQQLGQITKFMVPESAIGAPVVPPTTTATQGTTTQPTGR